VDDLSVIKATVQFLKDQVASQYDPELGKIGLEKPQADGNIEGSYTLVKPAVYDGWIPPKNYLDEYGYDVPCILVMSDGGKDQAEEAVVRLRLAIAIYDPGMTTKTGEILTTRPNSKGYYDLLNIITKIRLKLTDRTLTSGIISINHDFEWGMYEEQHYPYWHAWITYSSPILSMNSLPML
jgi:hypothetical protein